MGRKGASVDLNDNALQVLSERYLLRDAAGAVSETPEELFQRVAQAIALPEKREQKTYTKRFFELMAELRFLPNSPTLMNAGKKFGQLSACFVLPIEDSLDSIFDTLKHAALIHQSGGGTGFSFSRLRQKGAAVRSTHGTAGGPVRFLRIFDQATEAIKQGGTRRGANMGILRVDHPDILEFIDCKRDLRSVINFNLSIGITDIFMRALSEGGSLTLNDPKTDVAVKKIRAQEIWDALVQAAWETGDPGLVFLDRINRFNPTPKLGEMESTNPCGEQPLLPYESCNLGSINVSRYLISGGVDWKKFESDVETSTRFLDNVIDVNAYPVRECEKITKKNRKIGLGVMGFADLLLALDLPYDSPEARDLGEEVMARLDRTAKSTSQLLAKKRGAFPAFKGSLWQKLGYAPMRNATVSTVAPTGTISLIAGCSGGIEPIFSAVFLRNILDGKTLRDESIVLKRKLQGRLGREPLPYEFEEGYLKKTLGSVWSPAQSVSVDGHLRMQAVFQRFSDSSVSKTINLPAQAKPADVSNAYRQAYELGCKGITVYRDQSRPTQVLERAQACPEC